MTPTPIDALMGGRWNLGVCPKHQLEQLRCYCPSDREIEVMPVEEYDSLLVSLQMLRDELRENSERAASLSKWGIDPDATQGAELALDSAADRLEALLEQHSGGGAMKGADPMAGYADGTSDGVAGPPSGWKKTEVGDAPREIGQARNLHYRLADRLATRERARAIHDRNDRSRTDRLPMGSTHATESVAQTGGSQQHSPKEER